jgi:uncharacterized protein YaiI (UPF0178 family)
MEQLREAGVVFSGPDALNNKDWQAFSNQFDWFVTRHKKIQLERNYND